MPWRDSPSPPKQAEAKAAFDAKIGAFDAFSDQAQGVKIKRVTQVSRADVADGNDM